MIITMVKFKLRIDWVFDLSGEGATEIPIKRLPHDDFFNDFNFVEYLTNVWKPTWLHTINKDNATV